MVDHSFNSDPHMGRIYKTGMRVPITGLYRDQYGYVSHHEAHRTFPPCIDRSNECAYRELIRPR